MKYRDHNPQRHSIDTKLIEIQDVQHSNFWMIHEMPLQDFSTFIFWWPDSTSFILQDTMKSNMQLCCGDHKNLQKNIKKNYFIGTVMSVLQAC